MGFRHRLSTAYQASPFSGLRFQILGVVGLVAMVLLGCQFAIARLFLGESFRQLETARINRDTQRVQAALNELLDSLAAAAADEATWDATYDYAERPNLADLADNLPISLLPDNRINVLLIINQAGQIAYGQGFDLESQVARTVPVDLWSYIQPDSPLLTPTETQQPIQGIVSLSEGPLLVAAAPILTSDGTGPARGTLMMGRFLDQATLNNLARTTRLDLELSGYAESPVRSQLEQQAQRLGEAVEATSPTSLTNQTEAIADGADIIWVTPLDAQTVASYWRITDLIGEPVLVLKTEMPRPVYAQTQLSLRYYAVSTLFVGLMILALGLLLLDRAVVAQLGLISQMIERIGQRGDWSMRLPQAGNRELSRLADTINRMLEQLVRSQTALRRSKERYALAAEGSKDGLWDWNFITDDIYLSERATQILGWSLEKCSPAALRQHLHPGDLDRFDRLLNGHLQKQSDHFKGEFRLRHRSGAYQWIMIRGVAVCDAVTGRPNRMAGSLTDMSQHRAFYDDLTGLPNRTLFLEQLQRVLQRAQANPDYRFAVLFLDCDRFKVINDSLGHLVGDQLLRQVAKRLEDCLRPDDMVARLSGDEFTVLLEDIPGLPVATQTAERIHRVLHPPFELGGQIAYLTASIGIALNAPDDTQAEGLLRNANMATSQAKTRGRDQYAVFDRQMHAQISRIMQIETRLRQAIEQESLQLFYQPIVACQTAQLTGFESLVRWQHPERGMVSPAEFIPMAEETGSIVPLGYWILRQACGQLRAWQQQFPAAATLSVSVNLSRRQLSQIDLVEQIAKILAETQLLPRCLTLEITETVLAENDLTAEQHLQAFRKLGVKLSIDDFGTGYSSLIYLHRFPVDTLKIDRGFIQPIGTGPQSQAILQTIIALAHRLKMDTIAEGIETVEQQRMLQELRCDRIQGHLFSHALDVAQVEHLLVHQPPILSPNIV
ncbi:MAG: EAL domain-containing protein [Cyanobacteria bacterium P01_G01_bin.38]